MIPDHSEVLISKEANWLNDQSKVTIRRAVKHYKPIRFVKATATSK